ncbi:FAD-dependent oxidoreductase [Pseudarthrobacter sp. P1]|uniref:FAD-dependent oxidoreductase n=1 Tax=Pseudarthrobacter sp. P1 TaxID=3418418 RepID=UPI003CF2C5F4
MRAIVVGAGIAGLVTARQLGLAGWDVVLVEGSPGLRAAGYMMDFFGPGVEASERIGLYPPLAAVAYRVDAAEYVDTGGRVTSRLDYERFARIAGGKVLSLMRPDLELAALEALEDVPAGRVRVRYGARVRRAWADGQATWPGNCRGGRGPRPLCRRQLRRGRHWGRPPRWRRRGPIHRRRLWYGRERGSTARSN